MQITTEGIDLIKQHEGLRLEAYPDAGYGWARATIGYGHTSQAGPPEVTRGMRITERGAEEILRADLVKFERAVQSAVHVPLNDNQYSALVSFTFNVGPGAFKGSTLLRRLNEGNYAAAADQFLVWNKSAGKTLPGLVKRRQAERALFLKPVDRPAPKPAPAAPAPPPAPPRGGEGIPATAVILGAIAVIAAAFFIL